MSRDLPPHPNLDHLKKQAKELLRALRQSNPSAQLADAQHDLAREYGFASWPKLKAYVESVPRSLDSGLAAEAASENLFVGTWTANLAKSQRHPTNPFQSATVQFALDGDAVTIVDVVVDASGREEHSRHTLLADGHAHPSESGHGYALMANWRGAHVLETVATKDGQVVGWGRYEVSDDGRTLTISGDQQVIVLDRHGPVTTSNDAV